MKNKGITLIALVITIIILLILAGVTIALTLGEDGIIYQALQGKDEYTKAELKSDLELKIMNMQAEKMAKGEDFIPEDLYNLSEIGVLIYSINMPATGEYKDYEITINENYEVTIGKNIAGGVKPTITLMKNTEEEADTVTIKVEVTTEEGTIVLVTKPDGTTTTEATFQYIATENEIYRFVAEGSNGQKAVASIEVTNVKDAAKNPVIAASGFIPTLKATGVELTGGTVSITYDTRKGLENYYSIDDGATWNRYTEPFDMVGTGKILAKSEKKGVKLAEASASVGVVRGYIGSGAYDGDSNTYARTSAMNTSVLKVDSSVWGRTVSIQGRAKTSYNGRYGVTARGEGGTTLSRFWEVFRSSGGTGGQWFNVNRVIPEGCVDIIFHGWGDRDQNSTIYWLDIFELTLLPEE